MLAKVSEVPVCTQVDQTGGQMGGWAECLETVQLLTVECPLKSGLHLFINEEMHDVFESRVWMGGLLVHCIYVCVWQGLRGAVTTKVMLNKTFFWVTGYQWKHSRSPAERHSQTGSSIYKEATTIQKRATYRCHKSAKQQSGSMQSVTTTCLVLYQSCRVCYQGIGMLFQKQKSQLCN